MGIKSTKYKRSVPVPHTTRCKHVRRYAKLYSDDLTLSSRKEYVENHITPIETVTKKQFNANVSKLYNWLTRDCKDEYQAAIEGMFNKEKKDFFEDLEQLNQGLKLGIMETEASFGKGRSVIADLDNIHCSLMSIPRDIRINFLEKLLQTQRVSI